MIDNVLKIKEKIIYVRTIQKSNIKIIKRGKIDTPSTQIHDPLNFLAWYFNKK